MAADGPAGRDSGAAAKQTVLSHPGWSSDQTENHARSAPPSETGNRPPPKKQRPPPKTLPLPLRRPSSRPRPHRLLLPCTTTTSHGYGAHTALPTRRPSAARPGPSCTRRPRTTPSGRAPRSAHTCCSFCTRCRRYTRAGTAQAILGSAFAAARPRCAPGRRSARGSARRTTRSTRCSASPRSIARASTSAGRMGRRTGAVTE